MWLYVLSVYEIAQLSIVQMDAVLSQMVMVASVTSSR
jgi:hypothetical protein